VIDRPGFPERVFEFAFNAEFAHANAAALMACPDMPTQQEEKTKGYDVKFEINRRGGAVDSIFLQHKVSRFVANRAISNKHFYDAARGPYYAFSLDVDQYNLIRTFETRRKERIYYCAPLFTARGHINSHFASGMMRANSIWIDVSAGPPLKAEETHSIIYSEDAKRAFVFSVDPVELVVSMPGEYTREDDRYKKGFDEEEARKLYMDAYDALEAWRKSREINAPFQSGQAKTVDIVLRHRREAPLPTPPKDMTENGIIDGIGRLMAEFYGLSWLLVGAHDPN
jgi:hypothetical protein